MFDDDYFDDCDDFDADCEWSVYAEDCDFEPMTPEEIREELSQPEEVASDSELDREFEEYVANRWWSS